METEEHSASMRDNAGVHQFPWMPSRIHRENKQTDVGTLGGNILREALRYLAPETFHVEGLRSWMSLVNKYWRGLNKWALRGTRDDSLSGNPVTGYNGTSDGKSVFAEEVIDEGIIGDSTTDGKVVTDEGIGETTESSRYLVIKVNEGGIGDWALGGMPVQEKEKESKDIVDIFAGLLNG